MLKLWWNGYISSKCKLPKVAGAENLNKPWTIVFVFYYCIKFYHKFSDLKAHPFISSQSCRSEVRAYHGEVLYIGCHWLKSRYQSAASSWAGQTRESDASQHRQLVCRNDLPAVGTEPCRPAASWGLLWAPRSLSQVLTTWPLNSSSHGTKLSDLRKGSVPLNGSPD